MDQDRFTELMLFMLLELMDKRNINLRRIEFEKEVEKLKEDNDHNSNLTLVLKETKAQLMADIDQLNFELSTASNIISTGKEANEKQYDKIVALEKLNSNLSEKVDSLNARIQELLDINLKVAKELEFSNRDRFALQADIKNLEYQLSQSDIKFRGK